MNKRKSRNTGVGSNYHAVISPHSNPFLHEII